ncbi:MULTISPECIES: heparin lyase I family protein [unclassified Methylibium]|uniref:heparin lyase I family protein n=1 Tax=unclassified Methylibium TaxID=2633235 RepID=UPI0003F3DDF6|nr:MULTISPECIES: heparin lyase I family protein [unclassified Methylibium]EWS53339.1 hypothetical protein X551_03869 [Methylibium sp. T29]EWS58652.1 hypothetical protein Y694_03483 [Methylibium sp. T29-B]
MKKFVALLALSGAFFSSFADVTVQVPQQVIPGQSITIPADPGLSKRIADLEAAVSVLQGAPAPTPPASTPVPPVVPASSIAAADVFAELDANKPFAQQKGGAGLECAGVGVGGVSSLSDSAGYFNSTSPAGKRFGKVADPLDPSKQVLLFAPTRNDSTAGGGGSKRCEVSWWTVQSGSIKPYVDIWHAFGLLMPDGGYDFQAVISQYHQTTSQTVNPWSAIQAEKDRLMLFVRSNTNSPPTQATNQTRTFASPGIPKTKWTVFVIKMRIDPRAGGQGYFQAWRDGVQFANYAGPTGYATIDQNPTWQKFGFYPWDYANWSSPTAVRVLFKAPVYVKDPTGSKYSESDLRSYVLAR